MNCFYERPVRLLIFGLLILLIASGCGHRNNEPSEELKISIAEQYGLAYAPLQIMKEQKLMEKNLSGVKVEWHQLSNTAEIREAMLAGKVDAGFMAIPPFLIGWDKGMEWNIAVGLSSSPVGLVTNQERIKLLKDFKDTDRIALPQPGSVQHILLSMAAEQELGDANKLDNLLVTMKHPDGMNALLANNDITAHFTSLPYLALELENKDIHQVVSGREAIGEEFSFIVGVTTKKFHDINPEVHKAFIDSVQEAVDFINKDPEKAAEILDSYYELTPEEILKYLTYGDNEYSTTVKGVKVFSSFMARNGYLTRQVQQAQEVLWEDVKYAE